MKKLLVLVPLALLIIGCGGGEKNYYPLSEGNTWNYRTISTMTIGDSTIVDTGSVTTTITVKTKLNDGTDVYEQITNSEGYADTSYVQETDNYILGYDDKADVSPDTTVTLPVEEGNTWTVFSDSEYTETGKVMGKENVTVPAGSFDDCWKIAYITEFDSEVETSYVYLAPDVGLVKVQQSIVIDTLMTNDYKMELETYTVK